MVTYPLSPARPRALVSSSRLTDFLASTSLMNRFRLTGSLPATAFSALATWASIPFRVRRARSARYW